jgi:dihydrofolate reductase
MMRKIVGGLFISLDGVMGSAEVWSSPYMNNELEKVIGVAIAQSDAILLGRRTYQAYAALWPNQDGTPMADYMNKTPKYIVSTLDSLEWGPSSLVTGDLVEEIAKLKRQPGKNILVPGSPRPCDRCCATACLMSSALQSPRSWSAPACVSLTR